MGFIKYLGKEFKYSVVKWWDSEGMDYLVAIIILFSPLYTMITVTYLSKHTYLSKRIQWTAIIILLVLAGIILLVSAIISIRKVIDWFNNKYKEYKRER